jgi:heavy metal sensor kinase
VWSPNGDLLLRSPAAERLPIDQSERLAREADGVIKTVPVGTGSFRVLSTNSTIAKHPVVIQVAGSEARLRRERQSLTLILILGLSMGLIVAGMGGYVLARRALAPIDRMAERARFISAERLGDRLPVDNPGDELGRLASVFNHTLGTLESSFDQMRQFTADVSHELRTPLTAMRTVGEVGLRTRRSEHDYRTVIGSMLEEVDRLTHLVDRLLAISRADSGAARLSVEPVDLGRLAGDVAAQLGILAEEKQQSLLLEQTGQPICLGDRVVLRQALINLVDNAIKYSPVAGDIRIRVAEQDAHAILDVSDSGPGIAEESRTRIFDRHYRSNRPKASDLRGTGLGLSIAKWAAEASGGRLTLETAVGPGSTFRITLPRAQA